MSWPVRDKSPVSGILVTCTEHTWWYSWAEDAAAAEEIEIRHEQREHPDDYTVRKRESRRRSWSAQRHAEKVEAGNTV